MAGRKGCSVKISNRGSFARVAIMDEQDLHYLTTYNWSDNGNGYLRAFDKDTGRSIYLHRLIAGASPKQLVDHINRDTYDIRRCNLRIATRSENAINSKRRAAAESWVRGACHVGR